MEVEKDGTKEEARIGERDQGRRREK